MNRMTMHGLGRLTSALLLLTLGACTMVGHEKTEGWPQLAVTEHYVPNKEMRDKCGKYIAFGSSPMACAEFNLGAGTCDIWYSADFPPSKTMIEHEREHCEGYDHIGGTTMKDALHAFQASQANAAAQTYPAAEINHP